MDSSTSSQPGAVVVDTARGPFNALKPVPLGAVTLQDDFWRPRMATNRQVTIPSQHRQCEATGRIDNFRRASGRKPGDFQGLFFNDSDVYKWLEAASWTLAAHPDADVAAMADQVIDEIAAAQQPDGYLNTYFVLDRADQRYTNLKDMHELYCAGHFIQAAVAHHRSTGSSKALSVARKLADHLCDVFGPADQGKRPGTGGHEEIEMALVELGRDTGEERYIRQADYFLRARGAGLAGGDAYRQDDKPFIEQTRMVGHAVRHIYLACGATDLYAQTGDATLLGAIDRQWTNMTQTQMYITGGLGSRHEGETFGNDYELPNARAYSETCAAIGNVMWNWRLLQIAGDAKYADVMETALYNNVVAGLCLDGEHYFYQNPLANDGTHRRQGWFGCACCPPNIARMIASLPSYFYSVSDKAIWVHLYAKGSVKVRLPDGQEVGLTQETRYPYEGVVTIAVEAAGRFALMARVPGWCAAGAATITVRSPDSGAPDQVIGPQLVPGSYARLDRRWRRGDKVTLTLPMPVRKMLSHPRVEENHQRLALARGPLVYCFEEADNPGFDLNELAITAEKITPFAHPDLPVTALKSEGDVRKTSPNHVLYHDALNRMAGVQIVASKNWTAIPYFAWANRAPGHMRVWMEC